MKQLFFNKKAQYAVYDFIFQLLIVVGVGAALLFYVNHAAGETKYAKKYFARELAFDIDALSAAPGNVYYASLNYLASLSIRLAEGTLI